MYAFLKTKLTKVKYVFGLGIILLSSLIPLKVFAVDYGFYSSNDILFHDPNACENGTGTSTGGGNDGPVVAIGDSILQSAQSGGLKEKLKAKKYNEVTIDAVVSRNLASPGVGETDGLQAIDSNKDKIASAGTVLMVLGTNYDDSFESNLKSAIRKIKGYNSSVRIFWTNVGINTQTTYMNKTNSIISRQKTSLGYSIIDWHKQVEDNPNYIGDDDVHPNPTGAKKLAALIADSLGVAGSSGGTTGGGGAPVTGSAQEKNAATVWNYLTGKGLTAEQAAGFLGNMQAESGIEPDKQEYGSGVGYGLVQWSFGRRDNLENFARQQGKPVSDINVQLDFLWKELNSSYKSTVLNPLKQTTTVRAAAVLILLKFEVPANRGGDVQDQRTGFAEKWFDKLSGFGAGTTAGTDCVCQDGTSGTQPTIVLDPAHSGETTYTIDQETGVMDAGYNNGKENKDTFNVAKKLKEMLERNGAYKVILTKNSPNDSPTARQRVKMAENANATMAISIHTDSGFGKFGNSGQLYYQFVDGYRLSGTNDEPTSSRNRVEYTSSQTASKSRRYADKIKDGRSQNENNVSLTKANFDGRGGNIPPGNLPIVQLFSDKVPWVYNEAGATSKTEGINDSEQEKYAEGIYEGITKAIPPGSSSGSGCNPASSGDANAIVEWALKFSWDVKTEGIHNAKPIYKEWYAKYYSGDDYSACNQFVATVMRASGSDPKYSLNGTNDQEANYVKKHPEKYAKVTGLQSTKNLQPGDIFFRNMGGSVGHTFIYVGDQPGGNMREASYHSRPPSANNILSWYTDQSVTTAYRLK